MCCFYIMKYIYPDMKFIVMLHKAIYVYMCDRFVKLKITAVGRSLGNLFSRSDTSHRKMENCLLIKHYQMFSLLFYM